MISIKFLVFFSNGCDYFRSREEGTNLLSSLRPQILLCINCDLIVITPSNQDGEGGGGD